MRTISAEQLRLPVSKAKQLQKPRPPAPPEDVRPPQEVVVPASVINIDMSRFTEDNAAALKAITEAIKAQQPVPARPTEWHFDFVRDDKGFLKSVIAKAT